MKIRLLGWGLLLLISISSANASIKVTPNHVYRQTKWIEAEIELIRDALKISGEARQPGVQLNKKPLHVYAKSLEVLEKIALSQKNLGITPFTVGQIPLHKITPVDVLELSGTIVTEITRIKLALGVHTFSPLPDLATDRKPSHVYESLWRSSYLLDGIVGQMKPSFVYRNTELILSEIQLIAEKMKVSLPSGASTSLPGKTPKDVNLEGFKNLYRLARLQRQLEIDRLKVPDFPATKIKPSDVFDTTNTMIAELVRIKVALGIDTLRRDAPLVDGKTPADVFTKMALIGIHLNAILKKA